MEIVQAEVAAAVDVVELLPAHLPRALELSQGLQWPYRLEDWAFAHALGHGLAVELDGHLAGTALWWPYGERFASAGMIIVAPDAQRKGIGAALMARLLRDAVGRTLILNSTAEGRPLYSRLGFVDRGRVVQHQAILSRAPADVSYEAIRPLLAADMPSLHELDIAASGMDRRAMLDALRAVGEVRVVGPAGAITGYGCARRWGRGIVIGPVIAADMADARALIATLAASHVGRFVRIDVPSASGLSPWLRRIGLPDVGEVTAMTLGTPPIPTGTAQLFALSNQSLG